MKKRADKQDWQVEAIRKGVQQADADEFASRASVERLLHRAGTLGRAAKMPKGGKKEPVLAFSAQKLWRAWLLKNHATSKGLQLRVFKKATGVQSVTYDQALDEALCFGWIDGQKNKYDEQSWLQRFTPRRPRSLWSKRNRDHVARLIKAKQMMPAGLEEVQRAKKDGRWERAYDAPKDMKVPEDFLKALRKDKQGYQFFKSLNKANLYAIAWRLQLAKKPETRERWMAKILELMRSGTKIH